MDSPQRLPTQQPVVGEEGVLNQGIEMITGNDVVKATELAQFMEEMVVVRVNPEKGVSATIPVSLAVNGTRQHVFRGVPTPIRRKYVEVLARAVTTELDQNEQEMMEGNLPTSITTPAHAYTIVRDTPKGIAWLQDIQSQQH